MYFLGFFGVLGFWVSGSRPGLRELRPEGLSAVQGSLDGLPAKGSTLYSQLS